MPASAAGCGSGPCRRRWGLGGSLRTSRALPPGAGRWWGSRPCLTFLCFGPRHPLHALGAPGGKLGFPEAGLQEAHAQGGSDGTRGAHPATGAPGGPALVFNPRSCLQTVSLCSSSSSCPLQEHVTSAGHVGISCCARPGVGGRMPHRAVGMIRGAWGRRMEPVLTVAWPLGLQGRA